MTAPGLASRLSRRAGWLGDVTAEARRHRLGGEAARIAYYGFLSFFPAVLLVLAVTEVLGGDRAFEGFVDWLHAALPGVTFTSLQKFVEDVRRAPRPALVSTGAALLLWAASNALGALTLALNIVFGVEVPRPWWRRRALVLLVVAIGVTGLALGSAVQVAGPAMLRGPGVARLAGAWRLLRVPAVFVALSGGIYLLYLVLPNVSAPRAGRRLRIGAAVAAAFWMAVSSLLARSIRALGEHGGIYGMTGGLIALQVWLYLSALGVLLGAEVAEALERRARGEATPRPGPPATTTSPASRR